MLMRFTLPATALAIALLSSGALAQSDTALAVKADDQDVSGGTVTVAEVEAAADGWLVVHRTDEGGKPGPVIGHATLRKGANTAVTATLTEPVKTGDKLMLMIHGEDGGMKEGVFEYTLGAKEDGPVRVDGKPVTDVITAK